MFAENLLESAGSRTGRRGWTTAASITAQAAVLSLIALVPLVYPDAISMLRPAAPSIPIFTNAPPPPEHLIHASSSAAPRTESVPFVPVRNPHLAYGRTVPDPIGPAEPPRIGNYVPGNSMPFADGPGFVPPVRLDTTKPKPVVLSHMEPGSLIHNVLPVYPPPARQARIEGPVLLHAFISREGAIESLQVVSGHPFLARAALDAVRQWRYRPYVLNGQPVEVETQITVNFTLGKN